MYILTVVLIGIVLSSAQYIHDEDTDQTFPDWEIFYSPVDLPLAIYLTTINNCICRECRSVKTVCFGNDCKEVPSELMVTTPLLKLQLSAIAVFRKDDFRNFYNLTAMVIEGNANLYKIEPGIFKNMSNLRNLTITSNRNLTYLEENVFEGLVNIRILCISKNGFKQVSDITRACSPNYLPRVKLLSLAENRFHEIKYDDFYAMNGTNLQQLNLILCEIQIMHPDCLRPLKKLKDLRLCQNLFNRTTLTNLVTRTMELGISLNILNLHQIGLRRKSPYQLLEALGKSNLTYLILAGNNFNNIDDNWFPDMPNLTNLDMRFCLIVTITDNALRRLSNLRYLLLSGNKLISVPFAVTTLKYFISLDLSWNVEDNQSSVSLSIPENIFRNMTPLTYLKMSYNNIGSLTRSTFYGLTNLLKLIMKNASLSYIEEGTFYNVKKLTFLELTNNPLLALMPLTAGTFSGILNLRILLLGGCFLQNLTSTPSIFTYVRNLSHLALEGNNLHTILPNQLTELHSLVELQIFDNKLTTWNKRILPSSNMSVLNANGNKFTYITPAMVDDWKTVQHLYLEDNPFRCDCNWYELASEYKMPIIPNESIETSLCFGPEKWRRQSIVTYVNYLQSNLKHECGSIIRIEQLIIFGTSVIFLITICLAIYWHRWYIRYWIFLSKLSFIKHNIWMVRTEPKDTFQYTYDVFVSYSVEDRAWVQKLLSKMEPVLRLCVFERDFPPGASISQAILQAVASSRRTLLIVSDAFARSHWCRWETQLAEFHQLFFRADSTVGPDDKLIIVRLQPVSSKFITPTLRYLLKTRIYLEWPTNTDKQADFWDKLKIALATPKGELKYNEL